MPQNAREQALRLINRLWASEQLGFLARLRGQCEPYPATLGQEMRWKELNLLRRYALTEGTGQDEGIVVELANALRENLDYEEGPSLAREREQRRERQTAKPCRTWTRRRTNTAPAF